MTATPAPATPRGPAFILLSYARPSNMKRIVELILEAGIHSRIVVSNNNPDFDLTPYLTGILDDVELQQHDTRRFPGTRFEVARDLDAEEFISIDDDIFLTPDQIKRLSALYRQDPSCPHGIWGQIAVRRGEAFRLKPGIVRKDTRVDVLNRVYAFSRKHVERYFELLKMLGKDTSALGAADDLVLSFSGTGRPYCHDLGRLENCTTSNMKGVALWREEGFDTYRHGIFLALARALNRPVGRPAADAGAILTGNFSGLGGR